MHAHHAATIEKVVAHFEQVPQVQALLLGGSIAHGFATPASDVDIMIVVPDAEYEDRYRRGDITLYTPELSTYPGGYVDGKYVRAAFLRQVSEKGSEPARFAFQDARVLFSRLDTLDDLLRAAVRYPVAGKAERLLRFRAQLDAWNWYATEALRLQNRYLLTLAIGKLVLFGGRLILTHNEALYPYHKWFLTVLSRVADRPGDLMDLIANLYDDPSAASVDAFYRTVKDFQDWPEPKLGWGNQFAMDNELTWMNGGASVDDL